MTDADLDRLEKIARQHDSITDRFTIALLPKDVLMLIAEVRRVRSIRTIEAADQPQLTAGE